MAVYDAVNPIDEYETFYLDLAAELSAASIVDVGCGTGLLTCALARRGHRMIGVEPSRDARRRPEPSRLRPGGRVAFESRNPFAEAWTTWNPEKSRRKVEDAVYGPIEAWSQDTEVDGGLVRGGHHVRFVRSGEELVSIGELRFRARAELELSEAGFQVENVFGDWDGRPVDATTPEMIFVAVRGGASAGSG